MNEHRCQGKTASRAERQQLTSEPAYHFIDLNQAIVVPMIFNGAQAKRVMDAGAELLRQYGQMEWCGELAFVLNQFHRIYRVQLTAGGRDLNHPLVHEILW